LVAESGDWQSLSSRPSQRVGSLFRLQDALAGGATWDPTNPQPTQ
jgi:hypothetical protein